MRLVPFHEALRERWLLTRDGSRMSSARPESSHHASWRLRAIASASRRHRALAFAIVLNTAAVLPAASVLRLRTLTPSPRESFQLLSPSSTVTSATR